MTSLFQHIDKILNAKDFAYKKHHGQTRKGSGKPFVTHLDRVALNASYLTEDIDVIVAAFLHDTIEDTDTTVEEIREHFGDNVADLVNLETEDKSLPWKERKQKQIDELKNTNNKKVLLIALSDKLANLSEMLEDYRQSLDQENYFNIFNNKNKEDHYWYYNSFLEIFISNIGVFSENPMGANQLIREYREKLQEIFR